MITRNDAWSNAPDALGIVNLVHEKRELLGKKGARIKWLPMRSIETIAETPAIIYDNVQSIKTVVEGGMNPNIIARN